jgi:LmbE family N-acetylglucosaminyl deacetylase
MRLPADTWVGIFAHPDDEFVVGWPVFQDASVLKGAFYFVGENRPECVHERPVWEPALERVLESLGIAYLGSLGLKPDFYRMERNERRRIPAMLKGAMRDILAGPFAGAAIITHNPVGEYGHPDHLAVFDAVLDAAGPEQDIYVTDISFSGRISPWKRKLYYQSSPAGPFSLDKNRYREAVRQYEQLFHWTGAPDKSQILDAETHLYRL